MLDEIEALRETAVNEAPLWICNHVQTAYVLSVLKQRFVLIYHGQGDFVSDQVAFGKILSDPEKDFYTSIQKEILEAAIAVYFPSRGAYRHFLDTLSAGVNTKERMPLYDTIYDFPCFDVVEERVRKTSADGILTFLSIGQMTKLKEMDRVPMFLEQ